MTERSGRVVVVGAGVAGTAAAIAAARAGREVTVLDGGTGASVLATGALDFVPWDQAPATPTALSLDARAVLDALGAYVVGESSARLLTSAGVVRPAQGRDAALLDVAPLAGRRVGVVRCPRPGWDAEALAKHWGRAFVPIDAQVLRHADERMIPDADFAARHDEDARVGWLAERLRDALARAPEGDSIAGLVLPSSLGVENPRGQALSDRMGIPCGEAISLPGGPSGLRFARARDRAFATAGIHRVIGRVTRAAHTDLERGARGSNGNPWSVSTDGGQVFEACAVVLATGGLLGGGVDYAPSEPIPASGLPPIARIPVRLTLDATVELGAFGRPLEAPGSLFGIAPESVAWPFALDGALERAGVLVADDGACVRAEGGLYAAGELVADAPRTWLRALASGARAGTSAAAPTANGGPWLARGPARRP
jgi:glycerol-3-phosphate dehydrogenase subunit B